MVTATGDFVVLLNAHNSDARANLVGYNCLFKASCEPSWQGGQLAMNTALAVTITPTIGQLTMLVHGEFQAASVQG